MAPKAGLKGSLAPEWFCVNGMILVRDRSVDGNITDFACDGAEFRARLLALTNGRRILVEIERTASKEGIAFAALENNKATESM